MRNEKYSDPKRNVFKDRQCGEGSRFRNGEVFRGRSFLENFYVFNLKTENKRKQLIHRSRPDHVWALKH